MKRIIVCFSFFIFHFSFIKCQNGIISTIVGSGIGGYSGDGGQATLAEMSYLNGIAIDDSGNIYVADANTNNVIRKVSAKTGIITTIVGTGGFGYQGDGGPATAALLNSPWFIAIDKQFNIYFSDCANNVVRKVTYSTGIINTVAGDGYRYNHAMYPTTWGGYSGDRGQATNAELNAPKGIALDDSNNIFIVDGCNNVVRKVSYATGIITTVVGNGYGASSWNPVIAGYSGDGGPASAAELYWPWGLCFDKFGNMFISDSYNNVIREINSSGIITTIAGNHSSGFGYGGDGEPATNAKFNYPLGLCADGSGNLFLADGNSVIRFVSKSTGIISTIAGNMFFGSGYSGNGGPATNAELNFPEDVKMDSLGNLYISDGNNYVVREVTQPITTGVNELKKNEGVSVYPNPSSSIFTLSLSNINYKCNIEIYNIFGEEIYRAKVNLNNTAINLSGQPQGGYLYRVLSENGNLVGEGKILLQK